MLYRKLKGQNIFDGYCMRGENAVLIVRQNGVIENIVDEADAGDDIETFEGIVSPGFVNAHCHIELSHLQNRIPKHTGLVDFVQAVMTQRTAGQDENYSAMQAAADELYKSGTVAVGDICNTADSILLKKESPLLWRNFIEVSGFVGAGAQKRFDAGYETLQAFKSGLQLPEDMHTIVPHAPYSVSPNLFELLNEATAKKTISIHNQECEAENELYVNKSGRFLDLYRNFGIDISGFTPTGKRSVESWLPHFTKQQKIILVHNTFTTKEDLQYAENYTGTDKLFYCLCPYANLHIENCLPDVEMMLQQNCTLVMGTDSYASNDQLNMYEEVKTLCKNFPGIGYATVLQWATLNGAKALEMDDMIGSFDAGKNPGVVLLGEEATRIL